MKQTVTHLESWVLCICMYNVFIWRALLLDNYVVHVYDSGSQPAAQGPLEDKCPSVTLFNY